MNGIDPHSMTQVVIVNITGLDHRLFEIHLQTVPGPFPVPIQAIIARQPIPARIAHGVLGIHHVIVQAGQPDHRFGGGARWILPLQKPVEQRQIQRLVQAAIVAETDPGDEQVGVKTGHGHRRQHASGFDIQSNDRPTVVIQGADRGRLQAGIEVQLQIFARFGVGAIQHAQYPAPGVGFHVLTAHFAQQLGFILTFQAGLTNRVGAAVALVLVLIKPGQIRLADPAHVAQHVGKQVTLGVVAHQLGVHLNPFQAILVDRQAGDFLLGQAIAQGNGFKGTAPLLQLVVELFQVALGNIHQFPQQLDRGGHVAHPLANDRQGIAGSVIGEQFAIAVVDQPTGRRHRLHVHPVAVRAGGIVLVMGDLQAVVPRHQHGNQSGHDHRGGDHPAEKNAGFPVVIFKTLGFRHE